MYQNMIKNELERRGRPGIDPRHIEGWMRLQHSTLDRLSKEEFAKEVGICIECVEQSGVEQSEQLARSYGL